jgi:gas vesicle protein
MIRGDIEQTRSEMGDTLDALSYKANVPARTKGWMGRKRQAVTGACGTGMSKVTGAADSMVSRVSGSTDSMVSRVAGATPSAGQIQAGTGRMKDTAERNPLGLAVAGAAVGFLAGLFAPSTSVENEKLGPMADQVKSSAVEVGQEAVEHGKQVAQAAVQGAVDTAKEQGQQSSDELASSLQEKAREVAPPAA